MSRKSKIGLIGLGVMGKSLALNLLGHAIPVCVYDLDGARIDDFALAQAGRPVTAVHDMIALAAALETPRKILLMVPAGAPVDDALERILPCLTAGDIVIDGGNSHFSDTQRRIALAQRRGILYVGMGVSGGEEGALKGPCLMPGGCQDAWPKIAPLLTTISAALGDGTRCCRWIGSGGSGHYVKMVHNGIEYGDMQLICEAYQFLRDGMGLTCGEMSGLFSAWNHTELESYLIEITANILSRRDADGAPLLDKILDTAGQKGTGRWAVSAALDLGAPLTLVGESVFARSLASARPQRIAAARILSGPTPTLTEAERTGLTAAVRDALYASKIVSYAQGFSLLAQASHAYCWGLNLGEIALLWRGGCIIRSVFLDRIAEAFAPVPDLPNLMLGTYFQSALERAQDGWRQVCALAIAHGIPMPATTAALAYYDGCRAQRLPANLLQAQRDYFGAHRYERVDAPAGQFFHTNWTDGQ